MCSPVRTIEQIREHEMKFVVSAGIGFSLDINQGQL